MKDNQFKLSIVMAVYNVEHYVAQAIDSLIQQDIGFEDNIQLILVDDGSEDSSLEICRDYEKQYPANILVLTKENGGVSSTRNLGLEYVKGEFVSFMDSDDILSENTCSEIYRFFEEAGDRVDVVSMPMVWFEGQSGPHLLNKKFQRGNRIANLNTEYTTIQLSSASAFMRVSALPKPAFDTNLRYCEDAKMLMEILCRKPMLGLVNSCTYWVRRRTQGMRSATQTSVTRKEWWTDSLRNFQLDSLIWCTKELGYVPGFVQYLMMYDIQWRLQIRDIEEETMNEQELEEYRQLLAQVLQYIEPRYIMEQTEVHGEQKKLLLELKYGADEVRYDNWNAMLYCREQLISYMEWNSMMVEMLDLQDKNTLVVEGYQCWISHPYCQMEPAVRYNGKVLPCKSVERTRLETKCLGRTIVEGKGFVATIPLDVNAPQHDIAFGVLADGLFVEKRNLRCGRYFPISTVYNQSYYKQGDWMFTLVDNHLQAQRATKKSVFNRERNLLKQMWEARRRKMVLYRLWHNATSWIPRRPVWLLSDRVDKADDNAEAMFRYLCQNHKDVKACFVVNKDSADYQRLKEVGPVLAMGSFAHRMAYLRSQCILSSHVNDVFTRPFRGWQEEIRDIAYRKDLVFLTHGVTKHDISAWINRYNQNIHLYVATTHQEEKNLLQERYHYSAQQVALTGQPRFDRLINKPQKKITIMPTWRRYLLTGIDEVTGLWEVADNFEESTYCKMYTELLSNKELLDTAQRLGYEIRFLSHPNMRMGQEHIKHDPRVTILDSKVAYSQLFSESDLIVSDYSSTVFDFAYMRKPVLYYQADDAEFNGGGHTYQESELRWDSFGEIEVTPQAMASRIMEYMENGCQLKPQYRKEIDAMFAFSDQNNCQRLYNAIQKMEKGKLLC